MSIGNLQIGHELHGNIIADIIQRSAQVLVCVNEKGSVCFTYEDVEISTVGIINKFHELSGMIPDDIPQTLHTELSREMGAALYCALISETPDKGLLQFIKIENKIKATKTFEEAKSVLLLSSFTFSLIIILFLIMFQQVTLLSQSDLYLCMALGCCGSYFSLINRNKKVEINLVNSNNYIYIQSFLISITGMLSGLIVYIFSNADIAFGFVEGNLYALLAICLTAGFSERLIPDLFGKVQVDK